MAKAKTADIVLMGRFFDWVKQNAKDSEVLLPVYMLSFMSGLRIQEIAGLRWDTHIFSSPGTFITRQFPVYSGGKPQYDSNFVPLKESIEVIEITKDISKYTGGRDIPLAEELKDPLLHLWKQDRSEYVVPAGNAGAAKDIKSRAHALCVRANRWYKKCPYTKDGFTSHSGRRSFGTQSARMGNLHGCSLRDTQDLLGHSSIRTTQRYVDVSGSQGSHVRNLWK